MPWLVGIDEAGYGPNLGPFVMTAVACRLPPEFVGANLWQVLGGVVCRHRDAEDGRLLVDDSKLVYPTGLARLETGVLSFCGKSATSVPLAAFLEALCLEQQPPLREEAWYSGTTTLPVAAARARCWALADRLQTQTPITWQLPCSVVVCPAVFNALLDQHGSKSAVLVHCLGQLLDGILRRTDNGEAIYFHIDKHGGRNFYRAQLQDLLPAGLVLASEEGRQRSVYRVVGLPRPVSITFQPRADAEHLPVALASMVSKYVREVLMLEFNRFWQQHVPGLRPTAGYPGDAHRFWQAIAPTAKALGIPAAALWRRK